MTATPACRNEELGGRQQVDRRDLADRALVGRVEAAERVDLVAEELDPDRQARAGREDVDDPAAPGELAPAGDLDHRLVAEAEQFEQEPVEDRGGRPASSGVAASGRSAGAMVRWSSAWTLATRTRAPPLRQARQGGDPRRRLVGDELAPLVGQRGSRLEDGDRPGIAQPGAELLGHADRRSPSRARSTAAARRSAARAAARKLFAPCGIVVSPAWRPPGGTTAVGSPIRCRSEANEPVATRSGGRTDRSGTRRAERMAAGPALAPAALGSRRSCSRRSCSRRWRPRPGRLRQPPSGAHHRPRRRQRRGRSRPRSIRSSPGARRIRS